jgi:hypothetical protein
VLKSVVQKLTGSQAEETLKDYHKPGRIWYCDGLYAAPYITGKLEPHLTLPELMQLLEGHRHEILKTRYPISRS